MSPQGSMLMLCVREDFLGHLVSCRRPARSTEPSVGGGNQECAMITGRSSNNYSWGDSSMVEDGNDPSL